MIINFAIQQCPSCGKRLMYDRAEYINHTSHSCDCGVRFIYAEKEAMLKLADSIESDMRHYEEKV